jgi:hypothetical protein
MAIQAAAKNVRLVTLAVEFLAPPGCAQDLCCGLTDRSPHALPHRPASGWRTVYARGRRLDGLAAGGVTVADSSAMTLRARSLRGWWTAITGRSPGSPLHNGRTVIGTVSG